jgi:drug/metabolite transporter (DMT)-like permease
MQGNPITSDERSGAAGAFPFLLGSAVLGTIGVFVHEARADPLTATWFRCAFGLLGLTCWVLLRGQAGWLVLTKVTGPWVLAAGVLLVAAWALFFAAIERISTGVAVVLFHIQPLWVLLLGAWWLKEPVGTKRMASVGVAMGGLVLATGVMEHTSLLGSGTTLTPGYWLGVTWCLIGAVCTACVTLIAKRLHDMPPAVLAWWQCAVGTAVLWLRPLEHGWPARGTSWLWLGGLGLIHTGVAYTLMYAGIARLSAGRIAVFQFAYPAVAIVIDWLWLDQRLGGAQLVGIAIMSMSILYAELDAAAPSLSATPPRSRPAPPSAAAPAPPAASRVAPPRGSARRRSSARSRPRRGRQ